MSVQITLPITYSRILIHVCIYIYRYGERYCDCGSDFSMTFDKIGTHN